MALSRGVRNMLAHHVAAAGLHPTGERRFVVDACCAGLVFGLLLVASAPARSGVVPAPASRAVKDAFTFAYVDRWPEPVGDVVARTSWQDGRTGLRLRKTIHERTEADETVRTHVVAGTCGALRQGLAPADGRFIVAVRRWPTLIVDARAIQARTRFASVYAREPATGRIRHYRDVRPLEVADLTRRLLPYCEGT